MRQYGSGFAPLCRLRRRAPPSFELDFKPRPKLFPEPVQVISPAEIGEIIPMHHYPEVASRVEEHAGGRLSPDETEGDQAIGI